MLYHNNRAAIEVFTTCVLSGIKVAWKKCEENFDYFQDMKNSQDEDDLLGYLVVCPHIHYIF